MPQGEATLLEIEKSQRRKSRGGSPSHAADTSLPFELQSSHLLHFTPYWCCRWWLYSTSSTRISSSHSFFFSHTISDPLSHSPTLAYSFSLHRRLERMGIKEPHTFSNGASTITHTHSLWWQAEALRSLSTDTRPQKLYSQQPLPCFAVECKWSR